MIFFFPASLRSLWSPLVVIIGLVFGLIGAGILAEPRIGSRIDVPSVVIGLVGAVVGLLLSWRGVRMGVVKTTSGLIVRELMGTETYAASVLRGFGVGDEEHHTVPLKIVFPVLRTIEGDDIPVLSLATYALLPGARRRAAKAAETMATWMDRPVLDP